MTTLGIPISKVSPHFLHSNSTSHTWPFSAIAELIDNAYDPDVAATELHINVCKINGEPCLLFEDNGRGMDQEHLLKMLSFGFCEKDSYVETAKYLPIGHYGNGFKSGSMRLAHDALVLTVSRQSAGIGFLSRTYLEAIKADTVMVPILEYRLPEMERVNTWESKDNMDAILKHSLFKRKKALKAELQAIRKSPTGTGTKIILFNLKRLKNGQLELDFESDDSDIRNPEAHEADLTSVYSRMTQLQTAEYIQSLRAYCSILFLRPRMKIFIRGVKVKTELISKSLSQTEKDTYRPTWMETPLVITFGFTSKMDHNQENYGVMFYHRNRLIKAYEKLGYQKQANELGVGVVGVVEVDFLKPIHNKQNFEPDGKYNAVVSAIASKLNDYWNEKKNGEKPVKLEEKCLPDWLWAQCDGCLKWRRLPDSVRHIPLPDKWYCRMNPDPTHSRCDIPQEPEEEDLAVQRTTYEKTFKKKMKTKRHLKLAGIDAKEAELKAKEAELLERQKQLDNLKDRQLVKAALRSIKTIGVFTSDRDRRGKRKLSEVEDSGGKCLKVETEDMAVDSKDGENRDASCVSISTLAQLQPLARTNQVLSRRPLHAAPATPITFVSTRRASDSSLKKQNSRSVSISLLHSSTFTPFPCGNPQPLPVAGADDDSNSLTDENNQTWLSLPDPSQREDVKPNIHELNLAMETSLKETTVKNETTNLRQEANHSPEVCGAEREHHTVTLRQNKQVQANLGQRKEIRYKIITHKYAKLEQRFKELQKNVHTVFHFLVPDVDLGEEGKIETILRVMTDVICVQEKKD